MGQFHDAGSSAGSPKHSTSRRVARRDNHTEPEEGDGEWDLTEEEDSPPPPRLNRRKRGASQRYQHPHVQVGALCTLEICKVCLKAGAPRFERGVMPANITELAVQTRIVSHFSRAWGFTSGKSIQLRQPV